MQIFLIMMHFCHIGVLVFVKKNNQTADLYKMLHYEAFCLGFHCLSMYLFTGIDPG